MATEKTRARLILAARIILSALAAAAAAYACSFDHAVYHAPDEGAWGYLVSSAAAPLWCALGVFAAVFLCAWTVYLRGRPVLTAAIVAALYAVVVTAGRALSACNDLAPLFASKRAVAATLICAAGRYAACYAACKLIFALLDRERKAPRLRLRAPAAFAAAFGVILVCWLPYIIISYPGSVTYDAANQLSQFLGATAATNHHPWISTLLIGAFYRLGGGGDGGVFAYILFQTAVCAAAFAFTATAARALAGRGAFIASACYFALLPTWGSYMQMYVKDTLYAGVFAAFFTLAVLFAKGKDRPGAAVCAGLAATGAACALLRNNGIYAVVPALLVLVAASRGRTRKIFSGAACAGIAALFIAVNHLILPAAGIEGGSIREALSLPFQQTARWCVEYPDEAEAQREVIDSVLDLDYVRENYDPRVSDPVKNTYHGDSAALGDYLGLWLRTAFKHPGVYLEAAANACYGYFTPGEIYGPYGGAYYGESGGEFGVEVTRAHPEAAARLDSYNRGWADAPVLRHLIAPALYSWLLIVCTAALLRKKRFRAAALTLPLWITLAVNCVSPVNALVRYALPLMACAPLLCALTAASAAKDPDQ